MKVMIYPFPYISIFFLRELPKKIIWIGGVSSKKKPTFLELTCVGLLLIIIKKNATLIISRLKEECCLTFW